MCQHEYLFKVCDFKSKHLVMKKWNKIKVELEHSNCLLKKSIVGRKHIMVTTFGELLG
jgi:hypothetical protein